MLGSYAAVTHYSSVQILPTTRSHHAKKRLQMVWTLVNQLQSRPLSHMHAQHLLFTNLHSDDAESSNNGFVCWNSLFFNTKVELWFKAACLLPAAPLLLHVFCAFFFPPSVVWTSVCCGLFSSFSSLTHASAVCCGVPSSIYCGESQAKYTS